ncbi:phosphatidate cytidylyltransferase [Kocuria coralli]|uniref:Phosphatidate cytidylyltransferase n=1 Tax=Kocuria coralli TaxID=1461025 RepID=A0A5J5KZV8_9MICC|nr:phosphatidate cytidylyltransferase [Kocuria coralli]KAA9394251.1 phosphatidate cytidylyltransferase [Kocuria coralli]
MSWLAEVFEGTTRIGLVGGQAAWLLAGALVVLLAATVVVELISASVLKDKASFRSELRQRTWAWWIMIGALGLTLLVGETAVVVLFAVLSLVGLREMAALLPDRRRDRHTLLWLAVITPLHYWFLWEHWYGMFAVFIPVYAFLFLPAVAALQGRTRNFMYRAASVQWALMVCVYAVSYVPALLQLPAVVELGRVEAEGSPPGSGGSQGAALMLFLVIVVQGSDVLQYVWGKTLGRHPVAPSVSPNKTWEGLIGGVLTATALGAALWWATPFAPWQAAVLAFVSCVMGFLGGLVMSSIKRDRGVKDFGSAIPGHGGIMDRFDSLVFAAPVFFHLVRFFFT